MNDMSRVAEQWKTSSSFRKQRDRAEKRRMGNTAFPNQQSFYFECELTPALPSENYRHCPEQLIHNKLILHCTASIPLQSQASPGFDPYARDG